MSGRIVIKCDYLQSWKISSNTVLLEFGLAKSNLRHLAESEVLRRIPKYISFHSPVFPFSFPKMDKKET